MLSKNNTLTTDHLGLTHTNWSSCCITSEARKNIPKYNLNQQVIYNGMLPHLNRSLVEHIQINKESETGDTFDFLSLADISEYPEEAHRPPVDRNPQPNPPPEGLSPSLPLAQSLLPVPPPIKALCRPTAMLEAKIELMNIMIQHKIFICI